MNNDNLIAFGLANGIMLGIFTTIKLVQFRHAFLVPEVYAGRMTLRLMQSLSAAQNADNTLDLGMPLKSGKAASPEHKPVDRAG